MGRTYEENKADTALVVKRLKVLENIDGGGIREIRQTVNAVKQQLAITNRVQEEYWTSLSADGVISSVEKQVLKREIASISRSYSATMSQAEIYDPTNPYLASFTTTYTALYTYIYTTLKLFDDMTADTAIPDRDIFNEMFSNYYWYENFIQIAISAGILDQINFRVLTSLDEAGEENETGIYKGGLYQYTNGAWKSVTTGAYKGPQHELPGTEEGAFFISDETFSMVDVLIVNGDELYINGEPLEVLHNYTKGYIYYCEDGIWRVEDDLTNWRYAAAFADVINITGRLPQIFQDAIDDLQEQMDGKASTASLQEEILAREGQETLINGDIVLIKAGIEDITERATAGTLTHYPEYYGGTSTAPANPKEGDFYCYTGNDSNKSKIRRYTNGAWEWLDPLNTSYRNYYMMALEDVLACQVTTNGYFAALFCSSFWANEATMNMLSTKTIFIRQDGYIQSDNVVYSSHQTGMQIDCDGNADLNGNTHIGGTCTIDGNCTIGGNATFSGVLSGASGTFSGTVESSEIITSAFECLNQVPPSRTVTYSSGNKITTDLEGGSGTYDNTTFDAGVYQPATSGGYYEVIPVVVINPYTGKPTIEYQKIWHDTSTPEVYRLYKNGELVKSISLATLTTTLTFTYDINSGAQVFKFKNLPTTQPGVAGMLYVDNGFLKISQ